ncbi:unnamed protein product [Rotaria sp. Silwood1]|nr:unnamed protein product [Rotaria sp. Silwood1]CAF3414129.1 unnamed protein product [Rotaria sp. Silwood1]CAF4559644.1 unnamed protein product [Rotaria sp. Silwood1]
MTAIVEDMPVFIPKEEDLGRIVQQNYVLSSQYESLDSDDLYTKYKKLQRQLEFLEVQEAYVKTELKNLKKEMLHAQEEIKRIQSVPLVIGQFLEAVDQNTGIVGSTTGSNYYVRILSTIDRELLKAGASVALHKHSNALVDILPPESDSSISMLQADEKPDVDYSDIGGLDLQKQEIREAVELPLTHFELYKLIGIDPPRGVLMFGPPGCGKTMLAKAVARHTTASFIRVVGSEFVQKYLGEGPRMVRDVFRLAKENSPAIIFIDEIDAIATKRFDAQTGADREVQRILLELLNQMDGFDQSINVKVIMATNRADTLDPALLRPGRLDRKIEFPLPDRRQKRLIFSTVTSKMNLSDEVDLEDYVARPDHISGADINSICQEAGMQAVRENRYIVLAKDFEKAYKNVIIEMKVTSKTTAANSTNRISALDRLSMPTPNNNNKQIHQRLSVPTNRMITDARQLLTNRNTPIFDARQLLSRQSSKTSNTSLIMQKDFIQTEEDDDNEQYDDEQKAEYISSFNNTRFVAETPDFSFEKKNNTFVTFQKPKSTESISFTKTITNTSFQREDDVHRFQAHNTHLSSFDKKVSISVVKDQSRKRPKSPSPTSPSPPPRIRRLHDASIQTTQSSSLSRSPIPINSHRRHLDEYDDHYEPPIKRSSSRHTTIDKEQQDLSTVLKNSLRRTSTKTFDNTQTKQKTSIQSNSDATTVLVTNLQPSVTEDDVIELFSEVGHIDEIITLSHGCVQIVYSNHAHAEEAVAKYHNRLLDGQLIYVSLQQLPSYSTKSSKNSSSSRYSKPTASKDKSSSQSINDNECLKSNSNKIVIDPTFMRQALFYPSNNPTNPVQFQVKL